MKKTITLLCVLCAFVSNTFAQTKTQWQFVQLGSVLKQPSFSIPQKIAFSGIYDTKKVSWNIHPKLYECINSVIQELQKAFPNPEDVNIQVELSLQDFKDDKTTDAFASKTYAVINVREAQTARYGESGEFLNIYINYIAEKDDYQRPFYCIRSGLFSSGDIQIFKDDALSTYIVGRGDKAKKVYYSKGDVLQWQGPYFNESKSYLQPTDIALQNFPTNQFLFQKCYGFNKPNSVGNVALFSYNNKMPLKYLTIGEYLNLAKEFLDNDIKMLTEWAINQPNYQKDKKFEDANIKENTDKYNKNIAFVNKLKEIYANKLNQIAKTPIARLNARYLDFDFMRSNSKTEAEWLKKLNTFFTDDVNGHCFVTLDKDFYKTPNTPFIKTIMFCWGEKIKSKTNPDYGKYAASLGNKNASYGDCPNSFRYALRNKVDWKKIATLLK